MAAKTYILLFFTLVSLTLISACVVDGEDDVNPADPRDKFLGDWKVNESCTRLNYDVYITADPGNSQQVLIENFSNPGPGYDPAVALIVSNSIVVSSQNIGEGWTVSGQGTYQSDGTVQWSYSLIINGVKENCSAVYSR